MTGRLAALALLVLTGVLSGCGHEKDPLLCDINTTRLELAELANDSGYDTAEARNAVEDWCP